MMNLSASSEVVDTCRKLVLSNHQLEIIMAKLLQSIKDGLSKQKHDEAAVKCYNTHVQNLPTGKEKGKFLALDLGGTNFRVLLITLEKDYIDTQSKIYTIPNEVMTGSGTELFDHITNCLIDFIEFRELKDTKLPLGFTFSFPCKQIGLKTGVLQEWTKGFTCTGVVGQDVGVMLQEALTRRGYTKIEVCAVLNDTTGTLMSCAYKNPDCLMGIIIGTGCNACYIEKIENVELFDGDESKPYVIINTELGNFGADGTLDDILTEYDKQIDVQSLHPGKQIFEKLISGMHLGESVRLIACKLMEQKLLFNGCSQGKITNRGSFLTKFISDIESDKKTEFVRCRQILKELEIERASDQDCINLRYICQTVSRRSAYLISAAATVLLNKMNFPKVDIGVDGSVYRLHPKYHSLMVEKISELVNPSIKFRVICSEDGSGRGAALVAASATN